MRNPITKCAAIGLGASALGFTVPLLIDPIGKSPPPGLDTEYFDYAKGILFVSALIGLVLGAPLGALGGWFISRRAQSGEQSSIAASNDFPEWMESPSSKANFAG
jgi:hypothetical protein